MCRTQLIQLQRNLSHCWNKVDFYGMFVHIGMCQLIHVSNISTVLEMLLRLVGLRLSSL